MNDNILRSRRILIKRTEDGMLLADTRIIRFIKDRNICYISADSIAQRGTIM